VYLLDTNVCIGILKGNQAVVSRLARLSPVDIKICSVVKAELYYGAKASQQIAANLATLERFFEPFDSLPFDDASAQLYGQLRADLKRTGQPIGPNDMMIAAIALTHRLTVVTHNTGEFGRVPGLRLEDWESRG
jgi:tRNA(fMet)-specific endonuclease VapC